MFICSFALRLAPLDRYVTPDEPAWVYRAIRFADALAARDWTAVPSTGHPGVTTMWLGAAGTAIQQLLAPTESAIHLDWIRRMAWLAPENGEAFRHLAFFLPWGRVAVALVTTLGLVILYPLLARLFDRRVALLTVGLLAFDPFLTGHSGLLHTDALLATFSLLALAAALNGLRESRRAVCWASTKCWALSGLFTGLALLTKTPAIILPPFILLTIAIAALTRHRSLFIDSLFIIHCSLFIGSLFITIFALYPALWANPADTLHTLSAFAGRHVEMAQRPIFFAGQTTYDPGPAFYPVVLLFRISPLVLVGLVVGLVTLRRLPADRRRAVLLLLAFAVGFGVLMSLGAKKHDRYLLPALPPLALVAALGWEYASRRAVNKQAITSKWKNAPRESPDPRFWPVSGDPGRAKFHLLIVPIIQLALALPFIFYPLTAFNPLVGGPWVAARVLSTDWGEGMGASARWLNQLPDADRLTVAALSVPTFAPLFDGHTLPLDQASQADYFVLSPNQPTDSPVHTATLGFLDHAVVLTNTAPFEQSAYLAAHVGQNDLILLDAHTPLLRAYTGPGVLVSVANLPNPAAVAALLAEPGPEHPNLWLVADPAASPITAAHLRHTLDVIATPVSTATVASSTIVQYANPKPQIPNPQVNPKTYISTFEEYIALIDAILPNAPVNAPFPVFLRWQVPAPTPTDLYVSLHLLDSNGHLWAEVGQLALNDVTFPTSAWASGEWVDDVLTLRLPERIPSDTYALQLTVADSRGAQLGAWDADGQFQGVRVPLGDVEIDPPAEVATQQLILQSLCEGKRVLTTGPLLACAPELAPQTVPSGDTLTLALTWSATVPPEIDYRVRWRLLDAADSVALEQITDLSPYATSHWRAGDSFDALYDLRLAPTLPAARYTLALNVLTPDGRPIWASDETLTIVEILPRDRLFELPTDIAHPLHLTLGNVVHLRGFDLTLSPSPSPSPPELGGTEGGLQSGGTEGGLRPGDTLPLTLYWQADGPTDLDYTVFVHLVGPDGLVHGQADQFPSGGSAPTSSWVAGQVIVDEISLPVAPDAPASSYHIVVGLYDAASGGRLPITDTSGHLLPNDRAILPLEITITGGSQ